MGPFHIVIDRLSDVVQKSGSLCHPDVQSDLSCQKSGKLRHLDRMFQRVLTIACTEFHTSKQTNQLRMNSVYADFQCCRLSLFPNHGFYFFLCLFDHLFDSGRMNPSVHDQLFQCNSRNFTPDRIKSGEHNCLRRIINNQLNAG